MRSSREAAWARRRREVRIRHPRYHILAYRPHGHRGTPLFALFATFLVLTCAQEKVACHLFLFLENDVEGNGYQQQYCQVNGRHDSVIFANRDSMNRNMNRES